MLKIKNARDLMMVVLENKVKGRNLTNEFLVPRIKAGGVWGLKRFGAVSGGTNVQHLSGLFVTSPRSAALHCGLSTSIPQHFGGRTFFSIYRSGD